MRASGTTSTASVPPSAPAPQLDGAAQLAGDQGPHDLQPEPAGRVGVEVRRQAAAVVGHRDVQLLAEPVRRDHHLAQPAPRGDRLRAHGSSPWPGKPCSTALSSSSLSTITSGVAISAGSTPKLPWPGACRRSTSVAATSIAARGHPVHDAVELDRLVAADIDSVSCTSAIEATRRTDSSSAARASGDGHPAGLQPQQRGDRLQVVLHPVVDLPDGGVLGHQLPGPGGAPR